MVCPLVKAEDVNNSLVQTVRKTKNREFFFCRFGCKNIKQLSAFGIIIKNVKNFANLINCGISISTNNT